MIIFTVWELLLLYHNSPIFWLLKIGVKAMRQNLVQNYLGSERIKSNYEMASCLNQGFCSSFVTWFSCIELKSMHLLLTLKHNK